MVVVVKAMRNCFSASAILTVSPLALATSLSYFSIALSNDSILIPADFASLTILLISSAKPSLAPSSKVIFFYNSAKLAAALTA
jgi:hypothetical protein